MSAMRFAVLAPLALVALTLPRAEGSEAALLVTVQADRMVVEAGGTVSYAVRVDNVGGADAAHVRITAHLPRHTSAASEHCPDGTIEPDGDVCLQPELPTPGVGDDAHQVVHSRSPLPAGDGFTFRFRVRVDPSTPVGTVLRNHGHAAIADGPEATTAPVETLVVPRTPRAVVGAEGLDLAGGVSTDSFDASAGTYAETRSAREGNLASNGNITIGGTSVVRGDARPGPSGSTTLIGAARVTGSTAPAESELVLPAVDATAHATRNANERLCSAGSCDRAAYSSRHLAFSVSGSAVVPPGAYYLCELDVKGSLELEAPVTFWMAPPATCSEGHGVRLSAGASFTIDSERPGDLRIRLDASGSERPHVDIEGGAAVTGTLYGPGSEVVMTGGSELFGGLIAGALVTGSGGADLHLDRSLHP